MGKVTVKKRKDKKQESENDDKDYWKVQSPDSSSPTVEKIPLTKRRKSKSSSYPVMAFCLGVLSSLAVIGICIYYRVIMDSITSYIQGFQNKDLLHRFSRSSESSEETPPAILIRDVTKGIERRSNLSLEEFIQLYDAKWPVLVTDAMKHWPAMKKWTTEYFIRNYGEKKIYFHGVHGTLNQRQGLSTTLGLFLEHIHESMPNVWAYIGDEIFLMRHPDLRKDVHTPIYIQNDYFALFPEEIRPWNLMMLWGTQFSRSTLHIDPYNWTGTNAVIKGRKAWKLYPPGQDHLLYVEQGRRCGFPLDCHKYQSEVDAFDYNPKQYPLMKQAKAIEFDQYPGEMLFIPTGWFHQAYNREETLAISSQVMNTQNYKQVLHEIIKVGNIKTSSLSPGFYSLAPDEQVKEVISLIPKKILERGKRVNRQQIMQLKENVHPAVES